MAPHPWPLPRIVAAALIGLSGIACANVLENPTFDLGFQPVGNCTGAGVSAPTLLGQLANNWGANNCWMSDKPNTVVTFSAEPGRSGTGQAQGIASNSATGDAVIRTWVWLKPGTRYRTVVWMKADAPTEVLLQLRAWNSPYTAYGVTVAKLTTAWAPYEFEGLAPVVSGPDVPGGLFLATQGNVKVYVDDADVTPTPDATEPVQARAMQTVPVTYFGVHAHQPQSLTGLGRSAGSERLWDANGVQWADIFRDSPNQNNWAEFDRRLARAANVGATPLMVLGGNGPAWASSTPITCQFYAGTSSSPPANDTVWRDWVRAVATRAKGKVRHWEVWNEPYQCAAFKADPLKLASLVVSARAVLKEVDPTNVIVSPSFDLGDNAFLDRYLQAAKAAYPGGEAYWDVMSVHAYDGFVGDYLDERKAKNPAQARSVEDMFEREHLVSNTRAVLRRFGLDTRPIWNTEGGYLNASSLPVGTQSGGPNDRAGASFVARHMLVGWAAGLDANYYYAWDQRSGGGSWPVAGAREATEGSLVYSTTEAGTAYIQVSKWLTGAVLTGRTVRTDGTWEYTLKRGPATSVVAWNPQTTVTYTPPAGRSMATNLNGATTAIGASVPLDNRPVLFAAPPTTLTVGSSVTQAKNTQNFDLTATVKGGYQPTGTVQFKANGANLGGLVSLVSGVAKLSARITTGGTYTITAHYSGDSANPVNATPTGVTVKVLTCILGICY